MSTEHPSFWIDFRRFFGRGLGILLPSVLTLWILVQAYFFVDRQVAEPINDRIRQGVIVVAPKVADEKQLPYWFSVTDEQVQNRKHKRVSEGLQEKSDASIRNEIRQEQFKAFWDAWWALRLVGLVVAVLVIYLSGRFLGGFLGRRIYKKLEDVLGQIPVFKLVYPHVKQVVDMILGEKKMAFRRVILVQYPSKGIWTVGLVTGNSMKTVRSTAGADMLTVFIPSTPTPFTGFTISVPKDETVGLDITIDEAIRFFITGGVLVPERQAIGEQYLSGEQTPRAQADTDTKQDESSGPADH